MCLRSRSIRLSILLHFVLFHLLPLVFLPFVSYLFFIFYPPLLPLLPLFLSSFYYYPFIQIVFFLTVISFSYSFSYTLSSHHFLLSFEAIGWPDVRSGFRRYIIVSIQNIQFMVTHHHKESMVFSFDIEAKFRILKWKYLESPRPNKLKVAATLICFLNTTTSASSSSTQSSSTHWQLYKFTTDHSSKAVRGQTSAFRDWRCSSLSAHWVKRRLAKSKHQCCAIHNSRLTSPHVTVPLKGPNFQSPEDKLRNKNNSTDRTSSNWIPPASLCATYVEKYI